MARKRGRPRGWEEEEEEEDGEEEERLDDPDWEAEPHLQDELSGPEKVRRKAGSIKKRKEFSGIYRKCRETDTGIIDNHS